LCGVKTLRVLLIVFVLLAGLVTGLDRIANVVAEGQVANALQSKYELASKPDVSIGGFPLFTQVIGGKYDHITVTAKGVPLSSGQNADAQIDLYGLTVKVGDAISGSLKNARADRATVTVALGQDLLSQLTGLPITVNRMAGDKAKLTTTALGVQLGAVVVVKPAGDAITTSVESIDAGTQSLPSSVKKEIDSKFALSIKLPKVASGFTVTGVDVQDGSIKVTAEGHDVPLGS
jgi:hypothetical protein